MEEHPTGYRESSHEALYKKLVHDPRIQMDMVSPSIEGYFRIPAVWIGEKPDPASVLRLNPRVHHEVVFTKKLSCGIEVQVQRDGLFLFDFSQWSVAPQVIIPGYTKPSGDGPHKIPQFTTDAEEKAESYAVLRAQAMNVHQACLAAAEIQIKRRVAAMGFPVTAWNTEKTIAFRAPHAYYDDTEDMHALARNVLNNSYGITRESPLGRRLIEMEVVDYSMTLFDQILSDPEGQLMHLVDSFYVAVCRSGEKRFGEAITLAWSVCEQLIFILWKQVIEERRKENNDQMDKKRKQKLTGRDFTASVVIETLEFMGRIDHNLFRSLNVSRQARNSWAHSMRPPKESQIHVCIKAVEQLLFQIKGVHLILPSVGRGGVPQWPVYMMEHEKNHARTT